jgi:isoleucyl-tRNA synthetase
MHIIDRWAMEKLQELIAEVHQAYENFMFHRVFSLIYNFCTVEMSSIYMDVLKDRMYCEANDSAARRSGQTAMYQILDALVRMLAPILAHTAEEAWVAMPYKSQAVDSVHLALMPTADAAIDPAANAPMWEAIMTLRDEALKVLEGLRKDQTIGSNQEATVEIITPDEAALKAVEQIGVENFAALCIVSEVTVQKGDALSVKAQKSSHQKCQRCWNFWPSVGQNAKYDDLCDRCAAVVG